LFSRPEPHDRTADDTRSKKEKNWVFEERNFERVLVVVRGMSKPGVWHGEGPCASLNKKIERRKSPMQGYGLFATETIVQGELVRH